MLKKIISIVPVAALTLTVSANVQASTITVQKGDTLWDLARSNNTSVETIQTVNHLTTDLIHPGDLLTIAPEKHYKVKQGDTLWDIALDHRVTVSQLKEWNELHTDLIQPDLDLVIYEGLQASDTAITEKTKMPSAKVSKESTSKTTIPSTNNTSSEESSSVVNAPLAITEASKESTPETTTPPTNNTGSKEDTTEVKAPSTNNEVSKESAPEAAASSKEITVEATAYTASCEGCSGITSTGINLKENPDAKVISVDPTVIPLGSKVYVESYGEAIAGDTGGGIKGNKIDVFIPSQEDAIDFGVKQLKVTILD